MKSKSATFFKHVFPYKNKEEIIDFLNEESSNQILEDIEEISQEHDDKPENEIEFAESRRSKRAIVDKSFSPEFLTYMLESGPRTYKEAVCSVESPLWKKPYEANRLHYA